MTRYIWAMMLEKTGVVERHHITLDDSRTWCTRERHLTPCGCDE